MHQSRHARKPHPILFIDECPLEKWIKGIIQESDGSDSSDGLVPAQVWLVGEQDLRTAWYLLNPKTEHASTITPILVCPDDMDMICTVAVVEQVTDDQYVFWVRVGRALDVVNGVVASFECAQPSQAAAFNKEEFLEAFTELKRLTDEVWQ